MNDPQTLFNIAFSVAGALGMWVLNGIKDSLAALHKSDEVLTTKVQAIELLVAGKYVLKDEFKDELSKVSDALMHKLDKIDARLDTKLDRINGNIYYHDRAGDKHE